MHQSSQIAMNVVILVLFLLVIATIVVIAIIVLVKKAIELYTKGKYGKSQRQMEYEKMNIKDL